MRDLRKYVAEFIGTAVLVFVACGVAGQVCDIGGAGHLMTALAFGLVIVAMAYSIVLTPPFPLPCSSARR